MKKIVFFIFSSLLVLRPICADAPLDYKVSIVGGGIVGALESYYTYKEAQKEGEKASVIVYEKGKSLSSSSTGQSSTNTSYNIVPSLTIDEILSVVPRGAELSKKLEIPFDQPGGIRVDDVPGSNDSESAIHFKESVTIYGSDKNHDDRTLSLLTLGRKSMDLWQELYDEADAELKTILDTSYFNPCHEPKNASKKVLRDGYRIDLIYGIPNVLKRALNMKTDYEKLGYKNCTVLSPDEAISIDPALSDFCQDHSEIDPRGVRVWKNDSVALWRPGGCIDMHVFLPKFYAYLKKVMGQYRDADGQMRDCFELRFGSEVTGVEFDRDTENLRIIGLKFSNGAHQFESHIDSRYVFCPGESVGTLQKLGFQEPAFAAFAGPALFITIPLSPDQIKLYRQFSHCMEVHSEGIILSWQARFKEDTIFIGVGGTKAFYGDKQPNTDEAFAKNRNLLQLNMINDVLPEFISLACGYETHGKTLSAEELALLEAKGIARRWVGRRAVAYDGFPTIGPLYQNNQRVRNARCTTHLGSGGVSFGPGAIFISRSSDQSNQSDFVQKILMYADSRRSAK